MSKNVVFENEDFAVHVDGNLVMVENKKTNVWGRLTVDDFGIIFTCREDMQLANIMSNVCVVCREHVTEVR